MKNAFRRGLAALAAAAVATLSAGLLSPAQALTASIDQQQLIFNGSQSPLVGAQTFTAGTSAQLVRVSIPIFTGFTNATVGIQSTVGGRPSGTYLTSLTWSGSQPCCGQFHDFDLTTPISITKGTQYAIVVHRVSGSLYWYYASSTPSGFTGGQLFVSTCDTAACSWWSGGSFGADFAFKTWVASNTNQAPVLAADNTAISVPEGTAPSEGGSYSDPDGDTVALSASSGSVTKSGTSSGTWAWSGAASDEGAAQTVTITANDGHGLTATTSFSVSVAAVAPTAQIVTNPASAPEGTAVSLSGSATSPDAADNAAGFKYAWSVNKDGSAFAQASGASLSFTPDDEGTYVVTLQATDDGALTGTSSLTLIGTNVAPTATITGVTAAEPLVTTTDESITFDGAFSDPGVLDTHTATWNFGDGAFATTSYGPGGAANLSASHAYAAAGTYAVTLTVTDDDGGVDQVSTSVAIQTPKQAVASIASYVQGLSLPKGEQQSLLAKLNAAEAALERGDFNAAANELNAFLNELDAGQKTGQVTTAQVTTLRRAVDAVLGALGTYNRFLEWWPLAG